MNIKYLLPFILLILPLGYINAQINATFQLADTITCTRIEVILTNETTGPFPLNYRWDFGNGEQSTDSTGKVTYMSPGQYTIQLIADDGNDFDTTSMDIEILASPEADFEADTLGCVGFTSFFNDQSVPGDASINTWDWDFGDGQNAGTQNINHTYSQSGEFSPFLTVTDANGCYDIAQKINYIYSVPLPAVNFSFSPTEACDTPAVVDIQNTSSTEYGSLSYEWDFGDGANATVTSPEHTYSDYGDYTVTLTATNDSLDACAKTDSSVYQVINRIAGGHFSQDGSPVSDSSIICRGELEFTDTSLNATGSSWDFGDGGSSTLATGTYDYTTGGTYQVRLIAQPGGVCPDTAYWTLFVDTIRARFDITPETSCNARTLYTLSADSSNAASWEYIFDDGANGQTPDTTYEYELPAETDPYAINTAVNYETILEVVSVNGCLDRDSATVTIRKPTAWFEVDSIQGCVPLTVDFYDRSPADPDYSPAQFHWIFGDGDTQSGISSGASHDYTTEGEYEAKMVLENDAGCVDTSYAITIRVGRSIAADFSLNGDTVACANEEIRITNTSTDQLLIDQAQFYLGNEVINFHPDSLDATWVNRLDSGRYDGKLLVSYNGCVSEVVKPGIFQSNGPKVDFSYSFNCSDPMAYSFTGNINTYESFEWDFGDGNTNNSSLTPTNNYTAQGNYNVTLIATTFSGCSDTLVKTLQVRSDTAFIDGPTQACADQPATFYGTNSYSLLDYCKEPYLWYINDYGGPVRTNTDSLTHVFQDKGSYEVQLITENDNGCVDTFTHHIDIYKPAAGYTVDADTGCVPFGVTYTDTSVSDLPLMEWQWNFTTNDSLVQDSVSNTNTVQHILSEKGTFYPLLTVTDTLGCQNSFSDTLLAANPDALFSISDAAICSGDVVNFDYNSATQSIDSVKWGFDDGTVSYSSFDPTTHTYDSGGIFSPSLIVYRFMCRDTMIRTDAINVEKPNARFNFSAGTATCYPETITFDINNMAQNIVSGNWQVNGDTSYNYTASQEHIFYLPGAYPVDLNITTSNGCTDNYSDTLIVKGPTADFSFTPDSICKSIPLTVNLENETDLVDYYWVFNQDTVSGQTPYEHTVEADSATVQLVMTGEDNCVPPPLVKETGFYYVNADFVVDDSNFCAFTEIPLTNQSEPENVTYEWDFGNGQTSSLENPDPVFEPGEYNISLTILNKDDCPDTKTETITIKDYPPYFISSPDYHIVCENGDLSLAVDEGDSIEWFANDVVSAVDNFTPVFTPNAHTWYKARIYDRETGCFNMDSVFAYFQPRPDFEGIEITESFYHDGPSVIPSGSVSGEQYESYYTGEQVELEATHIPSLRYQWSSVPEDQCDTCHVVVVSPRESTDYMLTVSDTNNCFAQTFTKSIEVNEQPYHIAMPTAFTPSKKESGNDVVYVKGWGIQRLVEFSIYNRWGNRVFFSDDINQGWDGTAANGKPLNMDTYTYVVKIETLQGEIKTKQGSITLIR